MSGRRPPTRRKPESRLELARLFEETVGLYWRLTRAATAIYGRGPLSGPRRTILIAFARAEPQTVARLASSRAQSRQRLQLLVNALIAEGLLERKRNPLHQRSDLIGLTERGHAAVREIVETEASLRSLLPLTISNRSLAMASEVVHRVNAMFDDPDVLPMLKKKALRARAHR